MGEGFKIQKGTPIFDTNAYLYNLGDECTSLTGGWDYVENSPSGTTTRMKNSDHLYLQLASPPDAQISTTSTTNGISLTDYNTLNFLIDFTMTGTGTYDEAYVVAESTRGGYTAYTRITANATGQTVSVDVSALSGNCFIKFAVSAQASKTTTIKVYKVWCE